MTKDILAWVVFFPSISWLIYNTTKQLTQLTYKNKQNWLQNKKQGIYMKEVYWILIFYWALSQGSVLSQDDVSSYASLFSTLMNLNSCPNTAPNISQ